MISEGMERELSDKVEEEHSVVECREDPRRDCCCSSRLTTSSTETFSWNRAAGLFNLEYNKRAQFSCPRVLTSGIYSPVMLGGGLN